MGEIGEKFALRGAPYPQPADSVWDATRETELLPIFFARVCKRFLRPAAAYLLTTYSINDPVFLGYQNANAWRNNYLTPETK